MMQGDSRPTILALIPSYRPGFKGGGPIASLEAIVEQIGNEFFWEIATSDRDLGDRERYAGLSEDGRLAKGALKIHYIPPGIGRLFSLARLLRQGDCDLIYLNDMFSPCWGVWPLILHRLSWMGRKPVLVAPRNQFSEGALGIKNRKKVIFLQIAKWTGLWRGLCWQATCPEEESEIQKQAGASARTWLAPVLPNVKVSVGEVEESILAGGPLRVIFLSRISRKKNLECALATLRTLSCPVHFDIAGPADNDAYLEEIRALMAGLPSNVSTNYLGPVDPTKVGTLLASYHALLLPTLGENFGHVILESLAAGCPPIISDRTPWKDLKEKGCGWVIPLDNPDGFRQALLELNAMVPVDRDRMRAAARQYARGYIDSSETMDLNRRMFRAILGLP